MRFDATWFGFDIVTQRVVVALGIFVLRDMRGANDD